VRRAPDAPDAAVPPRVPAGRAAVAAWVVAAALSFWSFGFTVTRGSDLWWHLAAGRWTVAHGAPARIDPFSFTTAGRPWLNDAWLSDLSLYLWTAVFGLASLVWWKWALVVGTFLVLLRTLVRLTAGDWLASYAAALFALAVAAPFLDVRPQLYSLLGLAVVLELGLGRARPSRALPLVFLLWANLHAGVVLGLLSLPTLLLPAWMDGTRARRREVGLVGALCVLACVANPNGLEVFLRPLRYAFDPTSPFRSIGEWQPPFRPGGLQSPLFPAAIAAFAIAALAIVATRARLVVPAGDPPARRVPWVAVALGALTLAMALRSRRFVPFFAIAGSLAPALVMHRLLRPLGGRLPALLAPVLVAVVGGAWLGPYPLTGRAFRYLVDEESFPVDTCDFIEANRLSGDVFAYYNWGGYLEYRTDGRLHVFIDGRAGTVFSDDVYRRYLEVLARRPGWLEIVEGSRAPFVLWPRDQAGVPKVLLQSGRWRTLHTDAVSTLLVRRDHLLPALLAPAPASAYRATAAGLDALERRAVGDAQRHLERALATDPGLRLACDLLAHARASAGRLAAARRTMEHCERIFPLPDRVASFRAYAGRVTGR
jgi:hypothetical protein